MFLKKISSQYLILSLRFWKNFIHCTKTVDCSLHSILRLHDNFVIAAFQCFVFVNKIRQHFFEFFNIIICLHYLKMSLWGSDSSLSFGSFNMICNLSFFIHNQSPLTEWSHWDVLNPILWESLHKWINLYLVTKFTSSGFCWNKLSWINCFLYRSPLKL